MPQWNGLEGAICRPGGFSFTPRGIQPLLVLNGVYKVDTRSPRIMLPLAVALRRIGQLVGSLEHTFDIAVPFIEDAVA